jgi:cytochrome c5
MNSSKRIFPASLLGFVAAAVVVVVVGLAFFAPSSTASPDKLTPEAIAARLAPVAGAVSVAAAAAGSAHTLKNGETVYGGLCVACHGAGVAGAPKFGDKAAWKPRIAQGFDTLVKHATEGFKAMPPKGGGADLDPQEVARAVAFMADKGGASFKEP